MSGLQGVVQISPYRNIETPRLYEVLAVLLRSDIINNITTLVIRPRGLRLNVVSKDRKRYLAVRIIGE